MALYDGEFGDRTPVLIAELRIGLAQDDFQHTQIGGVFRDQPMLTVNFFIGLLSFSKHPENRS